MGKIRREDDRKAILGYEKEEKARRGGVSFWYPSPSR
jgi:hypothetical protein